MAISRAQMSKQISKGKRKKPVKKMRKKRRVSYKVSYKHYAKSRKRKKNLKSAFIGTMHTMPWNKDGMTLRTLEKRQMLLNVFQ